MGADPTSLALMPFLRPDMIKLDLRLIQERPSAETAAIIHAVLAETERTGAEVLAEGIETEEHLAIARSLGARYGQGWFFGRPEPVPNFADLGGSLLPPCGLDQIETPATPFDLICSSPELRLGSRRLLQSFSLHLEHQAHNLWEPPVVLAAFQDARFFTPATERRYTKLARRTALVADLGANMPRTPAPGVRGTQLAVQDPLLQEWTVAVLGPHFAGALIARQRFEHVRVGSDAWEFVITYRRETVVAAMRSLMARVAPV